MGSVFAFTQFLQFAHGYSALEAGAAMLPLALGLVVGVRGVREARRRVGRTRVIAGGLVGVGAGAEHEPRCGRPTWPRRCSRLVTFGLALSMGCAMAPSTDSVMSAVPEAKAGVGSAMSDVTRQVGGALGVAVIGSLIATAYSERHGRHAGGRGGVDRRGPRRGRAALGGDGGRGARRRPGRAFTDALGIGLTAAAGVALDRRAARRTAAARAGAAGVCRLDRWSLA